MQIRAKEDATEWQTGERKKKKKKKNSNQSSPHRDCTPLPGRPWLPSRRRRPSPSSPRRGAPRGEQSYSEPARAGRGGSARRACCLGKRESTREGRLRFFFLRSSEKRKNREKTPLDHFVFFSLSLSSKSTSTKNGPSRRSRTQGLSSCSSSCLRDGPWGPHLEGRGCCRLRLLPRHGRRRTRRRRSGCRCSGGRFFFGLFLFLSFHRSGCCCLLRGGRGRLPRICRRGEREREREWEERKRKKRSVFFFPSRAEVTFSFFFFFDLPPFLEKTPKPKNTACRPHLPLHAARRPARPPAPAEAAGHEVRDASGRGQRGRRNDRRKERFSSKGQGQEREEAKAEAEAPPPPPALLSPAAPLPRLFPRGKRGCAPAVDEEQGPAGPGSPRAQVAGLLGPVSVRRG